MYPYINLVKGHHHHNHPYTSSIYMWRPVWNQQQQKKTHVAAQWSRKKMKRRRNLDRDTKPKRESKLDMKKTLSDFFSGWSGQKR